MKRLMCVTPPPRMLMPVFQGLVNQFGNVIKKVLAGRREFNLFRSTKEIIDMLNASAVEEMFSVPFVTSFTSPLRIGLVD
jgi:hypothetical protein